MTYHYSAPFLRFFGMSELRELLGLQAFLSEYRYSLKWEIWGEPNADKVLRSISGYLMGMSREISFGHASRRAAFSPLEYGYLMEGGQAP